MQLYQHSAASFSTQGKTFHEVYARAAGRCPAPNRSDRPMQIGTSGIDLTIVSRSQPEEA